MNFFIIITVTTALLFIPAIAKDKVTIHKVL